MFRYRTFAPIAMVALSLLVSGIAAAQSPAKPQKFVFGVASVKPNKTNGPSNSNVPLGIGRGYTPTGGYFSATRIPLIAYLVFAYKITDSQLKVLLPKLPAWAGTEGFDIQARGEGDPTKDEMREAMQSLLEDRFKLVIHHETQQLPVYALMLVKPGAFGPHLRRHVELVPCTDEMTALSPGQTVVPPIADGFPARCGGTDSLPPTMPGNVRMGARISLWTISPVRPSWATWIVRYWIEPASAGRSITFLNSRLSAEVLRGPVQTPIRLDRHSSRL